VAAARRPFIQKEYAVVGQRHFAGHRHLPPTDQPHIGDGVMGGAKRPGRDQGRTVAREASDTMHACRLKGFRQTHRRQDGGEPARQLRLPCPWQSHSTATVTIP
jgi:hypothetical protein